MKILVINSWSSSLKYELFDMPSKKSLARWMIEKIWLKWNTPDHKEALNIALKTLIDGENPTILDIKDISAVWHRIVHWWEKFSDSVLINEHILDEIKNCSELAPLHNPANIEWIIACQNIMWDIPQIWVFDTAFHQDMDEENYLYAIPYKYYTKHKIRKYWFHGTSHKYVSQRSCEILNTDINTQKLITCHIWNWASITAIKDWKVVDTSMWFTPLAWLVMWTRSGDIDPAIVWFLAKKEQLTTEEIDTILNKKSWLLGVSEQSSDMREIETWDAQCQLALDIYINRIIKYIWSYIAIMWWLDTLVFTAWVWEKSPIIRKKILEKLSYLWIKINEENNNIKSKEIIISTDDSNITTIIVPTAEEMMIATDTYNLVNAIS